MPDQPSGSISEKKLHPQPLDVKRVAIPGGVEIHRRWTFKFDDLFIGIIGVILLVFELGNLVYVTTGGLTILDSIPIVFGPIMLYYALAHRFNSTRVSVVVGEIIVRKGPLPWTGNQVVPRSEVTKLILKGEGRRSKRKGWYTYSVAAILNNGKQTILDTSEKEDQTAFMRQELERILNNLPQPALVEPDGSAGG